MQISGSSYASGSPGTGSVSGTSTSGILSSNGAQFDPGRVVLADAYTRATALADSLKELEQLTSTAQPRRTRAALAASRIKLNLDVNPLTATTLQSTEEINATPTSFAPFAPEYSGLYSSTAPPALDGVYDGSNGSGTLTFEARRSGVHGQDNLRFWVRDPGGSVIDNFQVRAADPIDQQYSLGNGLIFTLGEGSVEKKDTFTVEVFADVGSVANVEKAFDGQGNDKPNIQYGLSVTSGSFDINGVTIAVNASDSINDVLDHITASSADVSAVFDPATEQIVLTRTMPGSNFDITLENDSSGFLQASKLDSALAARGTDGNADTPISDLSGFSAVSSGILKINDVEIAVDVNTDTLNDILARITSSDAFVSGNIINDRVFLQAKHRRDMMILDDGGTGLLDALHIGAGRYKPVSRDGVSLDKANEIVVATVDAKNAVNGLFGGAGSGSIVPAGVADLHAQVQNILNATGDVWRSDSLSPTALEFDSAGLPPSSRMELDPRELLTTLRVNFSDFKALFLGETPDARLGFIHQLQDVINLFSANVRSQLGISGLLVDLYV